MEEPLGRIQREILVRGDQSLEKLERNSGAIGFPSIEGALLSLAFLTFGVFFVDLIQQLLSQLRINNTTTVSPNRR